MNKAEVIHLEFGERIDVTKERVAHSVDGPALIVVIKENAAAEATGNIKQNHGC